MKRSDAPAPAWPRLRSSPKRAGSMYLFALGACSLVAVAGVTAVRLASAGVSTQFVASDADKASLVLDGGLEAAAQLLAVDPGGVLWRQADAFDLPTINLARDGSTLEVAMVDPNDADLSSSPFERVRVIVIATHGDVQRERELFFDPVLSPMRALQDALVSRVLTINPGSTFLNNATAATILASDVRKPIWANNPAATAVTGENYDTLIDDAVAITDLNRVALPPFESVLQAFQAQGATTINLTSALVLDMQLISPAHNPLGPTNPRGIYIINANSRSVLIKNSRIDATLVIHNSAGPVLLQNSVSMEPAEPGMPALVVRGSLTLQQDDVDLSEADNNVNFNPSGAPYFGATDSDQTDSYPSLIQGLVYASGDVRILGHVTIQGQLFSGGTVLVSDQLIIRYDPIETRTPPTGFSVVTGMRPVEDSVR